jgi:hypothetical protein
VIGRAFNPWVLGSSPAPWINSQRTCSDCTRSSLDDPIRLAFIPALDRNCFVVQNRVVLVEFTQSARKHRIGRARVRQVLADPVAEAILPAGGDRQERLVFLGDDSSGRALEVMAVRTDRGLLVIHAMDLRLKWRHLYEEGKR